MLRRSASDTPLRGAGARSYGCISPPLTDEDVFIVQHNTYIKETQSDRYLLTRIVWGLCLVLLYIVSLSAIFYHLEGKWSYGESVYFIIATIATIGYGDIHASTSPSKTIGIFAIILGVYLLWYLFCYVGMYTFKHEAVLVDVLAYQQTRHRLRKLIIAWTLLLIIICSAALFYRYVEHWTWVDSFYFCIVTVSTVGYGDKFINSKHTGSLIFTVGFIILGVMTNLNALSCFADLVVYNCQKKLNKKLLQDGATPQCIAMMDFDNDGRVNELDFVCFMLVYLGKVDKYDLQQIRNQFTQLKNNGMINTMDV